MMLTPEQLEGLRFALEATVHAPGLSVEAAHDLFNHIDAQQARIAELERVRGDLAASNHPASAQPVAVPDAVHAAVIGLGSIRSAVELGRVDVALTRVDEIRAMLYAAQKQEGV